MGVSLSQVGSVQHGPVLVLANHVSWLDVVVLNAVQPTRFVSKADIRRWPLLGFLVASGGTLFIERQRKRDAFRVVHQIGEALKARAVIAVFPEGTVGPGAQLLPFHAGLLQAAIATVAPVQPVALRFADAESAFSAAVLYIGETTLAQTVWRVACADGLRAHVTLLPVMTSAGAERRALARTVRAEIQRVLDAAR